MVTASTASLASRKVDSASLLNTIVNGRWRLKRLIGEGGMGAVYEGEHVEIGRKVAIKLVHAAHVRDAEFVARLKREARATGMLESENIVQVLDAGEDESAGIFIVMELLRGENLEQVLTREKKVAPPVAAMIALQAARGLSRAHAQGIVHRDLKPANLVLCQREDKTPLVKLVDFGIAKLVKDANASCDEANGGLTRTGGVVGTPNYMSPEQAQGLANVDERTDVYALGVLLYEMLAGEPAIPAFPTYEQKIVHIVTRSPRRVNEEAERVDPRLDDLVFAMMAKRPEDRPASMDAVVARLCEIFSPAELAPTSFNGLHLTATMAAVSAVAARVPTAPSSQKTVLGTGPAAATAIAVSLDRETVPEEFTPPGIPTLKPSRRFLAGAGVVGLIAIVGVVRVVSASPDPPSQSGLVAAPASAPASSVLAPTPLVIEPIATTTTPISAEVARPQDAPRDAAALPAMTTRVVSVATHDAGRAPAPKESSSRVFGGAGMANEF